MACSRRNLMGRNVSRFVIPAKAGNHFDFAFPVTGNATAQWIPAFAGMTMRGISLEGQ